MLLLLGVIFFALGDKTVDVKVGYKTSEVTLKDNAQATITIPMPTGLSTTTDYVYFRYSKESGGVQDIWMGTSTTVPGTKSDYPTENTYKELTGTDVLRYEWCTKYSTSSQKMQVLGHCSAGSGCISTTDFIIKAVWIFRATAFSVDANNCPVDYTVMAFDMDQGFDGYGAYLATASHPIGTVLARYQWIYPPMKTVVSTAAVHDLYIKVDLQTSGDLEVIMCFSAYDNWDSDSINRAAFVAPSTPLLTETLCDVGCWPKPFSGLCDTDLTEKAGFDVGPIPIENEEIFTIGYVMKTGSVADVRMAAAIDHAPSAGALAAPSALLVLALVILLKL